MVEEQTIKKNLLYSGTVVSDKMDKTVVVETKRTFKHTRFHKIVTKSKKYKVHDEKGIAKVGDIVEFYECRPLSKTKYMCLAQIVKQHSY